MFLIMKNGYYYRPNAAGYTSNKEEAGRYTLEEAAIHAGPNGADGSNDSITVWYDQEFEEEANESRST